MPPPMPIMLTGPIAVTHVGGAITGFLRANIGVLGGRWRPLVTDEPNWWPTFPCGIGNCDGHKFVFAGILPTVEVAGQVKGVVFGLHKLRGRWSLLLRWTPWCTQPVKPWPILPNDNLDGVMERLVDYLTVYYR